MTKMCRKCGLELGFRKLKSGKWCPQNPDGSDHWDLCRETRIANMSPWERVEIKRRDARRAKAVVTGKIAYAYCGTVPPWDESLGEFRDFTTDERATGIVCRQIGRRGRKREPIAAN